ncbi:MAG: hypothetical protein ACE5IT_09645 [bacterium]
MRKRDALAEKLRKLSESDSSTPIFKRRTLRDKLKARGREVSTKVEEKPQSTIMDFGLPEAKIKEFFRVETSSQDGELIQILYSIDNPKKRVKWTVLEDPQGWEFDTIKEEGLTKMKDYPPIYVYETDDGALLVSHVGRFTFTAGGSLVSTKELVKIFGLGLRQAKKLDIGISPLEKELEESSEKIKELKRKLEKKEAKIKILEGKSTYSDELEEELGRKDQIIISKSSEVEKLKENNVKLKSDIGYLKNLLGEYKASIDEKDKTIAEQKKKIERIENEFTQIKNEKEADKEELNRTKKELKEKDRIIASKDSKIKSMEEGK